LKKTLLSDMGRVNRKILPGAKQSIQKASDGRGGPAPQVVGRPANDVVVDDDHDGADESDEGSNDENVEDAANEVIDQNAWMHDAEADGYAYGIPIAQWAFVCRFEKHGLNIYNRRQTDNFYRAVLDCFQEYNTAQLEDPDVREADTACYKRADDPKKDIDQLRMFSLSQTLNLRRRIEAVGDGVDGMIKGHVTIRQCSREEEEEEVTVEERRRSVDSAQPPWWQMGTKKGTSVSRILQSLPVTCPIGNMWVASEVRVVVRIFSVYDMTPAEDEVDTYITLHLSCPGGEDVMKKCDELSPIAPGCDFLSVYWETEV